MTGKELWKWLAEIESPGRATLEPVRIAVGESDKMAGKLLLWLGENLPKDATIGFTEDVLTDALWWLKLFSTMKKAEEMDTAEALQPELPGVEG